MHYMRDWKVTYRPAYAISGGDSSRNQARKGGGVLPFAASKDTHGGCAPWVCTLIGRREGGGNSPTQPTETATGQSRCCRSGQYI